MIDHGLSVTWHRRDGALLTTTANGYPTQRAAIAGGMAVARQQGWTRPRWWQWWRWGDYDYSELEK